MKKKVQKFLLTFF